jgi:hypothetical protein
MISFRLYRLNRLKVFVYGTQLLVCNWPHSVGQNHFVVKMFFNRDSTIQSTSRRFSADYKSKNLIPYQPSGRRVIPSGHPVVRSFSRLNDMSYRPEAHQTKASSVHTTWIPVRTFLCVEKLRTAPASILPDVLAARLNNS